MKFRTFVSTLVLASLANAQCNPLTNSTCPQINGLNASTYEIDFTKQTSLPANWTLADQASVKYGANGAEFTFAKRYDAPYIWTSFYMLFGKIEVTMRAAPGQGIVSGAVMMSDDLDEIDWEWSGSNFNSSQGKVQTNYFGKGSTGSYDRGTQPTLGDDPTKNFHTYTVDWKQDSLTWSVDGNVVRQLSNNGHTSGSYQYPQTPSRLHLGLWNGGDESSDWGVVAWIGGRTDLTKAPYTAYVKSVKITNYSPCSSWQYPSGFSGKWQDVKCTNRTVATATAPSSTPKPTPANLPCNYTVVTNDTGVNIATKLGVSFSDLNITNQPIDWSKLLQAQVLQVPGGNCANGTTPMPSNSTTSSSSSSALLTSSTSTSSPSSPSSTSSTSTSSTTITSSTSTSSTSGQSSSTVSSSSTASSTSTAATPTPTACNVTYEVAPGDFGNKIAASFGIYFNDLSKLNPGVNWDALNISQRLNLPANTPFNPGTGVINSCNATALGNGTTCGLTYQVQGNDYGNGIAQSFGIYFNDLKQANPMCDWDKLTPGQTLIIPGKPMKTPAAGVGSSACIGPAINTTSASSAISSTSSGFNPATVVAGNPTTSSSTTSSSLTSSSGSGISNTSSTPQPSSTSPGVTSLSSNVTISPIAATVSGAVSPSSSMGASCGYQVAVGDYGYKIAQTLNCSFQALNDTNPGVDWTKLLIGAVLVIPGSPCAKVGSSSSTFSSSSAPSTTLSSSTSSTTSSSSSSSQISSTSASPASSSSTMTPSSTSTTSSQTSSSSSSSSISTPMMTSSSTTSSSSTKASILRCHHDNCLNNLLDSRYSSSAYQFCTSYLSTSISSSSSSTSTSASSSTPTTTSSMTFPTWLGGCKDNASRVSSACSCLCTASAASISSTLYHFDLAANKVIWYSTSSRSSSSSSMTPTSSSASSSSMSPTPSSSSSSSSSSSLSSSSSTSSSSTAPSSSSCSSSSSSSSSSPTTNPPSSMLSSNMNWGGGAGHYQSGDGRGSWGGYGNGDWGGQGQGQQYGTGSKWKREAEAAPPQFVTLSGGQDAWADAAASMMATVQGQAAHPMPTDAKGFFSGAGGGSGAGNGGTPHGFPAGGASGPPPGFPTGGPFPGFEMTSPPPAGFSMTDGPPDGAPASTPAAAGGGGPAGNSLAFGAGKTGNAVPTGNNNMHQKRAKGAGGKGGHVGHTNDHDGMHGNGEGRSGDAGVHGLGHGHGHGHEHEHGHSKRAVRVLVV